MDALAWEPTMTLEALLLKAMKYGWDCSSEGNNGEYSRKPTVFNKAHIINLFSEEGLVLNLQSDVEECLK